MADRLAKLEKAYRQNPDSPLFARLADLYLESGRPEHALEICLKGCEDFPDYATGFMILARCYETSGAVEEARDALDQALRLDPVNPRGYETLSAIYHKLGVPTLALKSLEQAAVLDPFAEDLPSRVDELTYEVRLESTREQNVGEVDPYVTPDQAIAEVSAGSAVDAAPESISDGIVVEEAPLNGGNSDPVQDGELVSDIHQSGETTEHDEGENASSDGATQFGVLMPEEEESQPSTQDDDESDEWDESTSDVDGVGTEADDDDLFSFEDEDVQDREVNPAVDPSQDERSAETRIVADSAEDCEDTSWVNSETDSSKSRENSHVDQANDKSVTQQSEMGAHEPNETLDISDLRAPVGAVDENRAPLGETPVDFVEEKVEVFDEVSNGEGDESVDSSHEEEQAYGRGGGLGTRGDDELLRLFQEIETQGSNEVDVTVESEDISDLEVEEEHQRQRITTPTLAEIYTIQGLTQKAIETYRELLEQEPNNDFIRRKLEDLESSSSKK